LADIDVVIVGAGVVGLATGASFARAGHSVIVLEKNGAFGEETSSRNSEVIHAGMYYPTDSLKAQLCIEGNRLMYDYCGPRGIMANPIGKLIVATSDAEVADLHKIHVRGTANGLTGLALLDSNAIKSIEPAINAKAAIYSPTSGIVDSHSMMLACLGEIEDGGGALVRASPFISATQKKGEWVIYVGGDEPTKITSKMVVLSAGLWSHKVAAKVEGLSAGFIPKMHYAKGNYFRYMGKAPFSHLIYPMPSVGGLGIHLTPDAAGHARFGPDAHEVTVLDYSVDVSKRASFANSIRSYWPELDENLLTPDYAGIRPKIGNAIHEFVDFQILDEADHGLKGLYCLFGIDSPGLTSSLAIANNVLRRAKQL
jgi:L-2-hydroxyglutarate oxidase LhgO